MSSNGAGYDTVDVDACTRAGVLVLNQAGGNAPAVAEMTLGLMLAVSRRIVESDRKLRTERGFARESLMGHDLHGRTLGVVGIGETGRRTAQLARAFGMRVLAHDPFVADDEVRQRGAEPVELDTLVRASDVVSLHCPRDRSTLGLFDAPRFAAMKPGAIFVSTARGGIHDEQALLEALRRGHLGGAGLDVWDMEPPPPDHPLLALPNVIGTPHIGGATIESRAEAARLAADQIAAALRGERPRNLINPEAWPLFLERLAAARED